MNVAIRQIKLALWDVAKVVWPLFPNTAADPVAPGLRATLITTSLTARALIASGTIQFSSANGHVTRFAEGSKAVISSADIAEVWVYLVEEFDRAQSEIGGSPTDAQIVALMESNLRPCMGHTNNFQFLSK